MVDALEMKANYGETSYYGTLDVLHASIAMAYANGDLHGRRVCLHATVSSG